MFDQSDYRTSTISEEHLREAVDIGLEPLGSLKLTSGLWAYLRHKGIVAEAAEGRRSLPSLIKEAYELLQLTAEQETDGIEKEPLSGQERAEALERGVDLVEESVWTHRNAVAFLVVGEAKSDPDVLLFRRRLMASKLLSAAEYLGWLEQHSREEWPPTLWLEIPREKEPGQEPGESRCALVGPDAVARARVFRRRLVFDLPVEPWRGVLFVRNGGILDQVRGLANQLASRYQWEPERAVLWLLTGALLPSRPEVHSYVEHPAGSPFLGTARIHVDADINAAVEKVTEAFLRERGRVLGRRHRALSRKHIDLGLFLGRAMQHAEPDAAAWARLFEDWNDENVASPSYQYKELKHFKQDAKAARARLLRPRQDDKGGTSP